MKSDERREQILSVAMRLFSQSGFNGTTTKEIAKASGISEAMVFRHFASKEVLYSAILNSKSNENGEFKFPWSQNADLQAALQAKDDFAVFYYFGLAAMTKQQSDTDFMRLLFYSALEEHQISQKFFNDFVIKIYEFLEGYIEQRKTEGAMRDINPRIVVRAFLGMLIHHSLNNILWDTERKILNITNEEAAKGFAAIVLNGVSK